MRSLWLFCLAATLAAAQSPDKGRQVIDEAVNALGGPAFLHMKNRVETGRAFSFYREQLSGLSIATIYTEYLDQVPAKGVAVRERQAFGKKQDYSILFLADEGYEVTFRGARPLPSERLARYLTTTATNIFYLLRERLNDPKMSYDFVRSDVVLNTQVNIVDVTDPEGRTVRVYFDLNTKFPLRQQFGEWDPVGRQRQVEVTDYSKYRAVGSVQWPYVIHRERNGEVVYESFPDRVEIDKQLPPKTFDLPSGVKMLKNVN